MLEAYHKRRRKPKTIVELTVTLQTCAAGDLSKRPTEKDRVSKVTENLCWSWGRTLWTFAVTAELWLFSINCTMLFCCMFTVVPLSMLPVRAHLRYCTTYHCTTYHRCHRRSVTELPPLLVHKRGISYLQLSVKWTVSRLSSAI